MAEHLPRLLFIGALPPPQHGVTGVNEILLRALRQSKAFDVRHLDISDRRPISTVEKFDWGNVSAALKHGLQCLWQLFVWRPGIIYVPISQKALGFLRDSLFLVPARLFGCGVVIHLHGGNFHKFHAESSPPLRWLIHFALKRVSAAIVLGHNLRDCFCGLVADERIVVVPNGIPDFEHKDSVGDAPQPHKRLRVLYLGTVVREKGAGIFVQAAVDVLSKTDAAHFVVAGPWYRDEEREELIHLVKAGGHDNDVEFIGLVEGERKRQLLLNSDVLVFPSVQQEGLPLVVLEAMCAGLTVIASDRGCLREIVVDGETGFIVPPNDPSAIAEKVLQLAGDRILCAQYGRSGRRRYEDEYRDSQFAQRMIKVFERVNSDLVSPKFTE